MKPALRRSVSFWSGFVAMLCLAWFARASVHNSHGIRWGKLDAVNALGGVLVTKVSMPRPGGLEIYRAGENCGPGSPTKWWRSPALVLRSPHRKPLRPALHRPQR